MANASKSGLPAEALAKVGRLAVQKSLIFIFALTLALVGFGGVLSANAQSWENQSLYNGSFSYIHFFNTSNGIAIGGVGGFRSGGRLPVFKTNDGGATWIRISQSLGLNGINLRGASFVSPDRGWVVGDNGLILKTDDGGTTWVQQNSGTTGTLKRAQFVDSLTGFVIGTSTNGFILKTTDGGANWVSLNSGSTALFLSLSFVDNNTGWVVGTGGTILKTTDGGASWTPETSGTMSALTNVQFVNSSTGWAVGIGGVVLKTINGGATWISQNAGAGDFFDLFFLDTSVGWVVGGQTNSPTIIRKTIDGGTTWTSQQSPITAGVPAVYFLNSSAGWIAADNGTIINTTNGGTTWVGQFSGSAANSTLSAVQALNETTAWAVNGAGQIIKTTSGGTTWTPKVSGTSQQLIGVHFVDASTGWVVGGGGTIRKSTDGGDTWIAQNSGTTQFISSLSFVSSTTGWVVGGNGTILKTVDGGINWIPQSSGTTNFLVRVNFVNALTGYAVGSGGVILKTTNGGTTWVSLSSGTTAELRAVQFIDDSTGWVVGSGGVILKTTNGGTTWVSQNSGTTNFLGNLFFISSSTGWVVGQGTIRSTTNGGTTWNAEIFVDPGLSSNIAGVSFANSSVGWIVGDSGLIGKHLPDSMPPTAPLNLSSSSPRSTQINTSWTASTDNVGVDQYRVERCQGTGCNTFAEVAAVAGNTTFFNDTGLSNFTSYSYRVRARDAAGNFSSYSNTTTSTTQDEIAPIAPTNFTATATTSTQIHLTWTASTDDGSGVDGYNIERCQGAGCNDFVEIQQVGHVTESFDNSLQSNTSYSYRVRARDQAHNFSPYSDVASATTLPPPDTTPPDTTITSAVDGDSNPVANNGSTSSTSITFTFTGTDNIAVTSFQCSLDSAAFAVCTSPKAYAGLSATSHNFQVRAKDAAGNVDLTPASYIWTVTACGNSILEAGEQCDDGNTVSGDGCSSTCQSENAFQSGGTKFVSGTQGPYSTPFNGVTIQSVSSTGTTYTVTFTNNKMTVSNDGPSTLSMVVTKNGSTMNLVIAPGSTIDVVGPSQGNSDLVISPLTGGVTLNATSGNDKAFALTVQRGFVGSGSTSNQPAAVNLRLVDSANNVTLSGSGETQTAAFDSFMSDGKDFTKYKPNALIIAPDGRSAVVTDETVGQSCKPTKLSFTTVGNSVAKMFVQNTKTGSWNCNNGTAVGGSLIIAYNPEEIPEGTADVPFIYVSPDNYWNVATSLTPPAGCTVDTVQQMVTVDQNAQAAIFTLTCPTTTAENSLFMLQALAASSSGKALGVSHRLTDHTKDAMGRDKNKETRLSDNIPIVRRGRQATPPGQEKNGGAPAAAAAAGTALVGVALLGGWWMIQKKKNKR